MAVFLCEEVKKSMVYTKVYVIAARGGEGEGKLTTLAVVACMQMISNFYAFQ